MSSVPLAFGEKQHTHAPMSTPKTKHKAKSAPPSTEATATLEELMDPEVTAGMRTSLLAAIAVNEDRRRLEPDNIVHINRLTALSTALAEFNE